MKKLILLLLIIFAFVLGASSQVTSSSTVKSYNGDEYIVFTFTNTSNSYVNKDVTIKYVTSDGKYSFVRLKKFDINLSPNEVMKGNFTYIADNNMILKSNGKYSVKSFEVIFE